MKSYAPVKSKNEVVKVVSYTNTRIDGNVRLHGVHIEYLSILFAYIVLEIPDISRINEESPVERAEEPGPVFEIEHKFYVSAAEEVRQLPVGVVIVARTDGALCKCTQVVVSTDVEQF